MRQQPAAKPEAKQGTHKARRPKKITNNRTSKQLKQYNATKKSFEYCRTYWPEVFKDTDPRPVCVGIRQDLLDDAKKRGIALTKNVAYNALYWLTSTAQYQEAIIVNRTRVDINGLPLGSITDEDRAAARAKLAAMPKSIVKIAEKVQERARAEKIKEVKAKRGLRTATISYKKPARKFTSPESVKQKSL